MIAPFGVAVKRHQLRRRGGPTVGAQIGRRMRAGGEKRTHDISNPHIRLVALRADREAQPTSTLEAMVLRGTPKPLGTLLYLTWGTLLPDPCFRLRVSRINGAVHGSDSRAYTQTGTLDESRFNYVFALYSAEPHTHLSFREGVDLVRGNRNPFDVFGWFTAVFEWGATFLLLAEDGRVKREDVHGIMDGTIFPKLAARTKARNEEKARAKAERKNKVKAD
ncbi:Caleosin related protein-domain-containing protein [Mycena olivaceomarginata]|nr:Caleosin related protein-domain-containing protein [Mycena olivaceomarginata]